MFIEHNSVEDLHMKCQRAYILYPDESIRDREGLKKIIGEEVKKE